MQNGYIAMSFNFVFGSYGVPRNVLGNARRVSGVFSRPINHRRLIIEVNNNDCDLCDIFVIAELLFFRGLFYALHTKRMLIRHAYVRVTYDRLELIICMLCINISIIRYCLDPITTSTYKSEMCFCVWFVLCGCFFFHFIINGVLLIVIRTILFEGSQISYIGNSFKIMSE